MTYRTNGPAINGRTFGPSMYCLAITQPCGNFQFLGLGQINGRTFGPNKHLPCQRIRDLPGREMITPSFHFFSNLRTYFFAFFEDFFFAFAGFFVDFAFFAEALADFFLPNAEAQLPLYSFVGPLRKIVMSVLSDIKVGETIHAGQELIWAQPSVDFK